MILNSEAGLQGVFENVMRPTINHYGDFAFEVKYLMGYKYYIGACSPL